MCVYIKHNAAETPNKEYLSTWIYLKKGTTLLATVGDQYISTILINRSYLSHIRLLYPGLRLSSQLEECCSF